ncbi:MAG: DUF6464 family protein [Cyanobacteria bacterium P01_D01_bin.105]
MLVALIIIIGLTPAFFSLIIGWHSRHHFQQSINIAADYAAQERLRQFSPRSPNPDAHYVDGMGMVIGDITCRLNAKSPFLRCAANPQGPCEGCREYEAKEYEPLLFE